MDHHETFSEKGLFQQFLGRLVQLDKDDLIFDIVWENYADKIRLFINNEYVTRWFWAYKNDQLDQKSWERKFERRG